MVEITDISLCMCRHIHARHTGNSESCDQCGCLRFHLSARTSASHYRRGARTGTKRVARLEIGDAILVGFPGRFDYVRGPDGSLVWEQHAGELTSHPQLRHVQDYVLRPADRKTGALVARVTGRATVAGRPSYGRRSSPTMHVISTDLGDLTPLFGNNSVMVVTS